ncbi:hypothetical protein AAKU67_003273 [Oxalobacteraceae bacterium GrIS 2.11]
MFLPTLRRSVLVLASLFTLTFASLAAAEPPSRAARLGYISGTVSFSPAGQTDWVEALVNLPLTTGDRLWSDLDSRAELQIGGAALRLGPATSVTVLNLDDRITQLQLTQGVLKVRVRRLGRDQSFEIDTPNLAFTLSRPGEYRIEVNGNDDATAVMVQSGEAEVYGGDASYALNSNQAYRFYGTGLSDYDRLGAQRDDDLDQWSHERDHRDDNSASARYVSAEVVGYQDLDANGSWRADPEYGNVWTPNHVAAGWTPYHDGHWAWVDPWGWTWVDDAPWGFAVSHYGRWANIGGAWGWVPGPQQEQAVYAPALVAFVGGANFQIAVSAGSSPTAAVAWFPLAPREVYQPSYPVSRGYFDHINRSNAVIAPTVITNVYNTTTVTNNVSNIKNVTNVTNVTNVVYVNQRVPGAVVAVPTQAFAQSQSVARAAIVVSKQAALSAPVAHTAAVVPVQQSVHGGAAIVSAKPPAREAAVVAHAAPPPPPVSFASQQNQLAAKAGAPISDAQRAQLKPAVIATKVNVVTAVKAGAATAAPPVVAPAARTPEARKVEAAKTGAVQAAPLKGDPAKADEARVEAAKIEAGKAAETNKAEQVRSEAARVEASRAEASRVEASRAEAAKVEAAKIDAGKAAAANKAEQASAEAANAEKSRAQAVKAEYARGEALKADAARIDANKAAAAKAEEARSNAAKADQARAAAAKADEARSNAAKADAARAEAARANAAKNEIHKAAPASEAANPHPQKPEPAAMTPQEKAKKKAEEAAQGR